MSTLSTAARSPTWAAVTPTSAVPAPTRPRRHGWRWLPNSRVPWLPVAAVLAFVVVLIIAATVLYVGMRDESPHHPVTGECDRAARGTTCGSITQARTAYGIPDTGLGGERPTVAVIPLGLAPPIDQSARPLIMQVAHRSSDPDSEILVSTS